MTKTINLREHEVLALKDGRLSLIVRPVKHCNKVGLNITGEVPRYVFNHPQYFHIKEFSSYFKCPLGPEGAEIRCKETWWKMRGIVMYQADNPSGSRPRCCSQMPPEYSRFTLINGGVEVRRTSSITTQEVIAAGCPSGQCFDYLWDTRYGKTEYAWKNNPPCWFVKVRRKGGAT